MEVPEIIEEVCCFSLPCIPLRVNWKSSEHHRYTIKEIKKFLIATAIFISGVMINAFFSILVLEKHIDPDIYNSLPDIVLDAIPKNRTFNLISERTMMILGICTVCLIVFSKNGYKVLRRYVVLAGIVYAIRAVAVYVTSIPVPNPGFARTHCIKEGLSVWGAFLRALKFVFVYWGFTANGVALCGDLIISGHTTILTGWTYIMIRYLKKNILTCIFIVIFVCGYLFSLFSILAAHNHYTIDVFFGIVITFFTFSYYHLQIEKLQLSKITKRKSFWNTCLIPFFDYMEADEAYPFINGFSIPFRNIPLTFSFGKYAAFRNKNSSRKKEIIANLV